MGELLVGIFFKYRWMFPPLLVFILRSSMIGPKKKLTSSEGSASNKKEARHD